MVLFLSYFIRVASNIKHPRAWIQTQFCIANIATGILVSSNPTNLLLVNAFEIRFVSFAKNMVVPVIATTILLFPFLLYVVFCDETLTPKTMISRVHYLPDKIQNKKPANPNIPIVRRIFLVPHERRRTGAHLEPFSGPKQRSSWIYHLHGNDHPTLSLERCISFTGWQY
jgi:Na+/H+ antiporter NhaD/arsenite permease-like protein